MTGYTGIKKFDSASNQVGKIPSEILKREIRSEWKALWDQKIEDAVRAEAIARRDYELLFMDKGTVIGAARKYKQPSLDEILEIYEKLSENWIHSPDPNEGGWRKFSKDTLTQQPRWKRQGLEKRKKPEWLNEKSRTAPRRHGGRGWAHKY